MRLLPYNGSTAEFFEYQSGIVLKAPRKIWRGCSEYETLTSENQKAFLIEQKILERLGEHSRIVPYRGPFENGLLLAEAACGSLQGYLDSNNAKLDGLQRWKMCEQIAEAVDYIHSQGVIHSDLRPDNILVHSATQSCVEIWLTDFGGSMCLDLGLDGGHLPDTPFFDPRSAWESNPTTDVFSLGSIFYTILTGHWPFLNGTPKWKSLEDKIEYEEKAEEAFRRGDFPCNSGFEGGDEITLGCWKYKFQSAKEVLEAIRKLQCKPRV